MTPHLWGVQLYVDIGYCCEGGWCIILDKKNH